MLMTAPGSTLVVGPKPNRNTLDSIFNQPLPKSGGFVLGARSVHGNLAPNP